MSSIYSNTGFVLKNDVYARGTSVSKDGVLRDTKRCSECCQALDAKDIVYYVFSSRGTQAAQSRYVHTGCEVKCRIEPFTSNKSVCRICGTGVGIDGCFTLPTRKIYYHQSCLPKVRSEVVSDADLEEKLKKRAEGRMKRGRLFYSLKVLPYKGIDLVRESYESSGNDEISIVISPIDGRLKDVHYSYGARLFYSGRWVSSYHDVEAHILHNISYYTKDFTIEQKQELLKGMKSAAADLQKHYDKKGYPIDKRLDADFHLRFLLEHGNSVDGMINEAKR